MTHRLRALLFAAVLLVLAPAGAQAAGERYLFSSSRCDDQPVGSPSPYPCWPEIWASDEDGGNARRLTSGTDEYSDRASGWWPDGSRFLFLRATSVGAKELWSMDPDGGDQRRITPDPAAGDGTVDIESAVPAPDGSRIAFVANGPGQGNLSQSLYIMRPDGSDVHHVIGPRGRIASLRWSADASRLAFSHQPGGDRGPVVPLSVRPDGTGAYPVVNDGVPLPEGVSPPELSPDGRHARIVHAFAAFTLDLVTGRFAREGPIGTGTFDSRWLATRPATLRLQAARPLVSGQLTPSFEIWDLDLSGSQPDLTRRPDAAPDADPQPHGFAPVPAPVGPTVLLAAQIDQIAGAGGDDDLVNSAARMVPRAVAQPRLAVRDLGFVALGFNGAHVLRASVGLRSSRGRCRYLTGSGGVRLGKPRSCRRATSVAVGRANAWARRTHKLRRGTYEVRFAAVDQTGRSRLSRTYVAEIG